MDLVVLIRRVQRGGRLLVARNSRPAALVSPVPSGLDLKDFILASHPCFRKRYREARRSVGISLAQLKA